MLCAIPYKVIRGMKSSALAEVSELESNQDWVLYVGRCCGVALFVRELMEDHLTLILEV